MKLRVCVLSLLTHIVLSVLSQSYTGKVVDACGNPIKGVSVLLLSGMHPVTFTRTTETGYFQISSDGRAPVENLLFSSIGYTKDTIPASTFKQGQTICLHEQELEIHNVMVVAPRIREHGDTLDYLVSNFKQQQDRSLADVIRKMPGIEVRDDGSIEYQGTRINKFYIEGMDLLGGRYTQASENLSADKVMKVQVLQNHQPVKMLRNIEFSRHAALNIILVDSVKNVWQGMIDLSQGAVAQGHTRWLGDVRSLAMLFSKKKQSISLYKYNNMGKDIATEVKPEKILEETVPTESKVLEDVRIAPPALDERRTRFNDTHIAATNWLFKPTADSDLRIQLSGLIDQSEQRQYSETSYIDSESGYVITEDMSAQSYRREYTGDVLFQVNDDKLFLSNNIRGYVDFNECGGYSVINGQRRQELVKPRKSFVSDNLSLTKRLGPHQSLSVKASLSYTNLPGRLMLADSTQQRLDLSSFYYGASLGFRQRVGSLHLGYVLGVAGVRKNSAVESKYISGSEVYMESQGYFSLQMGFQRKHWKINSELPVKWLKQRLDDANDACAVIAPQMTISYVPSSFLQLSLSGRHDRRPVDYWRQSQLCFFTNYITLQEGVGHTHTAGTDRFILNVTYKHPVRGLFASLTSSWNYTNGDILYKNYIANSVRYYRATSLLSSASSYNVYGRLSKSYRWSHLFMALSCFYSSYHYETLYSDKRTPSDLKNITTSFNMSLQPLSWFAVEAGFNLEKSIQRLEAVSKLSSMSNHMVTCDLKFVFSWNDWQVEWKNEYFRNIVQTTSNSFFSDINCSYKKKNYEIGVSVNNILGITDYQQQLITVYRNTYLRSRVRSREVSCRVSFGL